MMATTATSARPEIELRGTSGNSKHTAKIPSALATAWKICPDRYPSFHSSVVDVQPAIVQGQPACIVLVHKRNVVGGNDDRGP